VSRKVDPGICWSSFQYISNVNRVALTVRTQLLDRLHRELSDISRQLQSTHLHIVGLTAQSPRCSLQSRDRIDLRRPFCVLSQNATSCTTVWRSAVEIEIASFAV
jgi:hypothetical protein